MRLVPTARQSSGDSDPSLRSRRAVRPARAVKATTSARRKPAEASERPKPVSDLTTPAVRRKAPVRKPVRKVHQEEVPGNVPEDVSDADLADLEAEFTPEAEPDADTPDPDGMHTMDGKAAQGKPRPVSRNLAPSQLYRGRAKMALLRDLAMGEWTDATIARSVGVPTVVIQDFRETYEHEINEVRLALAGQLAVESSGLWISKQYNRLAEMQQDFEDIDFVIDVMRENTKTSLMQDMDGSDSMVKGDTFDTNMLLGSRRHQNLLRSKLALLKSVADELDPRRKSKDSEQDEGNTVKYVITSDATDGDDILQALT